MRFKPLFLLASLGLAVTQVTTARAQTARTQVTAHVHHVFEHRARTGTTSRFFAPSASFEATGRLPLLVRFRRPLTAAEQRHITQKGATFGRTLASGAIKVTASEEALRAMEQADVLERASVDLRPRFVHHPDSLSRATVGFAAAEASYRAKSRSSLTGKGVVVADLDTSADVFHPAFFRASPPVGWVDANGDGELTPDIDGVDLDGDGALAPTEIFRLLDGHATTLYQEDTPDEDSSDPAYNPSWDYLFLDANGDGKRNVGSEVKGSEGLPSMGEAVYIGDDVDQDGVVQTRERVLPLGDSKVRAVRLFGKDYVRGTNLAAYKPTFSSPDDTEHATSVLGTVGGGQVGLSRFAGVAPDVEFLLSVDDSTALGGETLTDQTQWLLDQAPDVLITELGLWGYYPSDGSTELELLLNAAVEQGTAVVSPAGNLGESNKHALAVIPPGSQAPYENKLYLDKGFFTTGPVGEFFFSVTWPEGDQQIAGSLTTSDGDVIELGQAENSGQTAMGRSYEVSGGVTPRGAGYLIVALVTGSQFPDEGTKLQLHTTSTSEVHASLFVIDDVSSWEGGMNWKTATAVGCMDAPSFAEKVLSVGVFSMHVGYPWAGCSEDAGDLCSYSGLGPDLWGDRGIDITGPEDAVVAGSDTYTTHSAKSEGKLVWTEFNGTSAAGPQVAGVVALTKQAFPELKGEALQKKVLEAAVSDAQVKAGKDSMWGAGKLHLPLPPADGQEPSVKLVAPKHSLPGSTVSLTAKVGSGDTATPITARWDTDYDGTWDLDDTSGLSTKLTMPATGALHVKVEVIDASGWSAQATALVLPGEDLPEQGGSGGSGGSGGTHAGGAGKAGAPTAGSSGAAGAGADAAGLEVGGGCAVRTAATGWPSAWLTVALTAAGWRRRRAARRARSPQ